MTIALSDLDHISLRVRPAVLFSFQRLGRASRVARVTIYDRALGRTVAVDVHVDHRTSLIWAVPIDPAARPCCAPEWRATTRAIVSALLRDVPEVFDPRTVPRGRPTLACSLDRGLTPWRMPSP